MQLVTSTDAKRNLGALLDKVQSGDIVEIVSFGKSKAVLMSTETFATLKEGSRPKRERVFGSLMDILGDLDVNALLATPVEGFEEYMPSEPPTKPAPYRNLIQRI